MARFQLHHYYVHPSHSAFTCTGEIWVQGKILGTPKENQPVPFPLDLRGSEKMPTSAGTLLEALDELLV